MFPIEDYTGNWEVQQVQGKEDKEPVAKYRPFLTKWFEEHGEGWPMMRENDELLISPPERIREMLGEGKVKWTKAKRYLDEGSRGEYVDETISMVPKLQEAERRKAEITQNGRFIPIPGTPEYGEYQRLNATIIPLRKRRIVDVGLYDILTRSLQQSAAGNPDPKYREFIEKNVYDVPPEERAILYSNIYNEIEKKEADPSPLLNLPEGRQFLIDALEREGRTGDPKVAEHLVSLVTKRDRMRAFGSPDAMGQYIKDIPRHFPPTAEKKRDAGNIAVTVLQGLVSNPAIDERDITAGIENAWATLKPIFSDRFPNLHLQVVKTFGNFYRSDPAKCMRVLQMMNPTILHEMLTSGALNLGKGITDVSQNRSLPREESPEENQAHLSELGFVPHLTAGPFGGRIENELGKLARPPETMSPDQQRLFAQRMALQMLRLASRLEEMGMSRRADKIEGEMRRLVIFPRTPAPRD
jgi:hypothetical protein